EALQCAAIAGLRPDDYLLYAHRGVAYWVARGIPPEKVLCDLAGRECGTNRGKGGVMRVVYPELGVLGESGTLGGCFPIATGAGLSIKVKGGDQAVLVFFGDGTSNRGTFHESLNLCAVRKLPVVFLCENNGWAVSMPTERSTAVRDIADRAKGYAIPGVVVDGNDPEKVFDAVGEALKRARSGAGPSLIEAKTYRLWGHWIGDPDTYRSREEIEKHARRSIARSSSCRSSRSRLRSRRSKTCLPERAAPSAFNPEIWRCERLPTRKRSKKHWWKRCAATRPSFSMARTWRTSAAFSG